MPRVELKPLSNARYCGRCGDRLTQSNKSKPPRCINERACEARAEAKFGAQQVAYTSPVARPSTKSQRQMASRPKFNDGLTFEHIVEALCQRFGYNDRQRGELFSDGMVKEYQRARFLLGYLLVDDLGISQDKAAEYLRRERKTVGAAYVKVSQNKGMYYLDIEAIRRNYPLPVKQSISA